jgi:hypothetical protein
MAVERFVDRVVDDLVQKMVQPLDGGRSDVHGGPLPDSLQSLEHFDFVGAITLLREVVQCGWRNLRITRR